MRQMPRRIAPLAIAGLTLLAVSGCAVSRTTGSARSIGSYDYCVVGREGADRYAQDATKILDRSFVVLAEDDSRLRSPVIRAKACVLHLDWSRGFWSSSASAEIKDYRNADLVQQSFMRRGMFGAGHRDAVLAVLHDVAAARASGPPVPAEARLPPAAPTSTAGSRAKAERLTESNDQP
jgi:hypothetical protein